VHDFSRRCIQTFSALPSVRLLVNRIFMISHGHLETDCILTAFLSYIVISVPVSVPTAPHSPTDPRRIRCPGETAKNICRYLLISNFSTLPNLSLVPPHLPSFLLQLPTHSNPFYWQYTEQEECLDADALMAVTSHVSMGTTVTSTGPDGEF
jgi:hypothetical protein